MENSTFSARKTKLGSLIVGVMLACSASAFAQNTQTPAQAYCDDLKQQVDERLQKSMQQRMPSEMPGGYMDKNFSIDEIVGTKIDFGVGSTEGIMDMLMNLVKSKVSSAQNALLGELNGILQNELNSTAQQLTMPAIQSGVSAATQTYSPSSQAGNITQPSAPLVGTPGIQPQQSGAGSTGGVVNFFRNLF